MVREKGMEMGREKGKGRRGEQKRDEGGNRNREKDRKNITDEPTQRQT